MTGTSSHARTITADGASTGASLVGAGAGGSIWVMAGTLMGIGLSSFRAQGGSTTHATAGNSGPGGGGGRVALEYDTLGGIYTVATVNTYATAYGGSSAAGATRAGAAETVFLKSSDQTHGELLIHNNGLAPTSTVTTSMAPLPATPTITTVSATTLNASSGTLGNNSGNAANQWVGFHVNPNTSQNATLILMDGPFFAISANTSSSLTVASRDTTAAPVNAVASSTFRPVLDLDNFEVAGNATLDLTGVQVRVRNGDLSANDTTTFRLDGILKAHTVDIGTSGVWSNPSSYSETGITRKCSSTSACP